MKSIREFSTARAEARPIVMATAYDALMARLAAEADIDALLVGDSVAMVVHGFPSTVHATLEMMCAHTAAVRRGAPDIVVVVDLPFLAHRRGKAATVEAAGALMQAGATAVKLEGVVGHEDVVELLVGSGIPVMGHLGLTPQSVNLIGGYRLQGRSVDEAEKIRRDAARLAELGAFAVVLECVPAELARAITGELSVPTIGIGAGADTAGQILVLTDLLGLDAKFRPKFARRYLDGAGLVRNALRSYAEDVRRAGFPAAGEILA